MRKEKTSSIDRCKIIFVGLIIFNIDMKFVSLLICVINYELAYFELNLKMLFRIYLPLIVTPTSLNKIERFYKSFIN